MGLCRPNQSLFDEVISAFSHHQTPRHDVVQGLFLLGPAGHHEADVDREFRNDLAEIAAGRPAESDSLAGHVRHHNAERHFAEGTLIARSFHQRVVEPLDGHSGPEPHREYCKHRQWN